MGWIQKFQHFSWLGWGSMLLSYFIMHFAKIKVDDYAPSAKNSSRSLSQVDCH